MPNKIKPKRSYTANAAPTTSDLDTHELAIRWTSENPAIFTKDAAGNIVSVTLGGGGGSGEDAVLRALFVPAAPTSVTATAGNAQATVSWTAPTGVLAQAPVTDYVVQYSSNSGSSWTTFSDGTSTATSAIVTGLAIGTAYVFRVAAVNAVGTGAYSTASAAVTPTAFAATSITGLQLWLDASDASTLFDATTGGSLVAADGGVARWGDKSGNGRHATQSTSGNRPSRKAAAQNGNNCLRFDGADDCFIVGGTQASFKFLHDGTQCTVYWVAKFGNASDPNTQYAVLNTGGASGNEIGYIVAFEDRSSASTNNGFISSAIRDSDGNRAWLNRPSNVISPQTCVMYEERINATNETASLRSLVTINGVSVTSTNSLTGAPSSADAAYDMTIGSITTGDVQTTPLLGDLCEILIYNSALSDADRAKVQAYLMAKWGIS